MITSFWFRSHLSVVRGLAPRKCTFISMMGVHREDSMHCTISDLAEKRRRLSIRVSVPMTKRVLRQKTGGHTFANYRRFLYPHKSAIPSSLRKHSSPSYRTQKYSLWKWNRVAYKSAPKPCTLNHLVCRHKSPWLISASQPISSSWQPYADKFFRHCIFLSLVLFFRFVQAPRMLL